MHIFSTVPISFAQAALGGDVKIQTVDGAVIYNVKPGTKTDTKVRLKGKGVPSLRNSAVRGDHYVTLVIQTPEYAFRRGDFKILLCTYVPYGLGFQTSRAVRIPVPDRDHIMQ